MGILGGPLEMMRGLELPHAFSVIELGDQWVTHGSPHRLAKEFYENDLKCGRYESIDGNGRGTILADLNKPLPKIGQFDLVTDFGTGEHVFDQCQVFKSIHYLVRKGGYFVFDRPSAGYGVHCYWIMNRCVIEDFAEANEYEVVRIDDTRTSRGELLRGVLRKVAHAKFVVPQQGRYRKVLRPIINPELHAVKQERRRLWEEEQKNAQQSKEV